MKTFYFLKAGNSNSNTINEHGEILIETRMIRDIMRWDETPDGISNFTRPSSYEDFTIYTEAGGSFVIEDHPLAFSPDESIIVAVSDPQAEETFRGDVNFYNESGKLLESYKNELEVMNFFFSNSGEYLIVGFRNSGNEEKPYFAAAFANSKSDVTLLNEVSTDCYRFIVFNDGSSICGGNNMKYSDRILNVLWSHDNNVYVETAYLNEATNKVVAVTKRYKGIDRDAPDDFYEIAVNTGAILNHFFSKRIRGVSQEIQEDGILIIKSKDGSIKRYQINSK